MPHTLSLGLRPWWLELRAQSLEIVDHRSASPPPTRNLLSEVILGTQQGSDFAKGAK